MAKSARASTMKANRSNLRSKVFGPVEDARTARLADKLLELASTSKRDVQMQDDAEAVKPSTDSGAEKSNNNSAELDSSARANRIVKSTDIRDKREKRKSLHKNRSSTTFKTKSKTAGQGKR